MESRKEFLRKKLLELGAVKFGEFVLTSGKKSDYYVDIKDAATDPHVVEAIGEIFSKMVAAKVIAGMELGAVPLLVSTSLSGKIRYVIIRKERKHGTGKLNIGEIVPDERVDIIEDVVTTGNSVLKAVNFIRESGGIATRAYCVVDREEGGKELLSENGVELHPIFRISELRNR